MIRIASIALLLAIIGLATTLAWELDAFAPPPAAPGSARPATVIAGPGNARPDHTAQWVATILARPLFSPTRRPAAVKTVADDTTPAGLPRLSGVLVGPFGRSAIFAGANGKPLVVNEGGHVNAWVVRSIDADAVKVAGSGGVRLLHPKFQNAPIATTSAPMGTRQRIGWSLPR